MKNSFLVFLIFALLFSFASCSSNSSTAEQKAESSSNNSTSTTPSSNSSSTYSSTTTTTTTTTTTSTDGSKTLTAKAGEQFTISLDENPTTGYTWSYFITKGSDKISFVSEQYNPNLEALKQQLLGAGGVKNFVFSAKAKGEAEIIFSYKRVWESAAIQQETYKITIE